MQRTRPDLVCRLAPVDHPWAVERALARVRPALLALIEAELWPCRIAAAKRHGIPVALCSGRISERSFARYRRVRAFVQPTLARIDLIAARSEMDAERFRALGARSDAISVAGDLKFDLSPSAAPLAAGLLQLLGDTPAIVAGSTHAGEEVRLLTALRALETGGVTAVLVLAPRDTTRAREIAGLAAAAGRRVVRRSAAPGGVLRPGDVLVLDTLGELRGLYAHARVAFVGGSLVPIGGHNLLEPAAQGRPVVFGPHVGSAPHIARLLEHCGGGRRVADDAELVRALRDPLADRAEADRLGRRGRAAIAESRGSSRRCAELIAGLLAGRDARRGT
jgi:3-deoxy-D-manno-octulosonic-acid transferase